MPAHDVAIDLILYIDEPDPPLTGWLDDMLLKAALSAGVHKAQINLVVVGDDMMSELHEQYTGVAGTTDVLTFDLREESDDNLPIEADIIVCFDEARRQAMLRHVPVQLELLLYAVHGLLHLMGEDDHDEADYQRMHAREDELLSQMGFGPVFHRAAASDDSDTPPDDSSTRGRSN